MKKQLKKIEDFFFKIYSLMEKSTLLVSIKQGFMMIIPVFMIGAFALLAINIPIEAVQDFIKHALDGLIYNFIDFIHSATLKIASLYILIAVTYRYSLNYTNKPNSKNIICCMVALGAYFAFLGIDTVVEIDGIKSQVILFDYLDVKNVFSALLTAYLATKLFFFYGNLRTKKKRKFDVMNTEADFRMSISSIFPMLMTIMSFVVIASLITFIFDVDNFNVLIVKIVSIPFDYIGRNVFSATLLSSLQSLFWFFGIHGSNTFESINISVFSSKSGEIFTKTFFDVFVLMGGCGSAICLLIAIMLFSKSHSNRNVVRHAALPMAFNINEIMVFGLPIVLNPILLIPFMLVPITNVWISFMAMNVGFVPVIVKDIYWTTPVFLSGILATNSFSGAVLQFFNIFIGVLIYIPFVKLNDRIQKRKFYAVLDEMKAQVQQNEAERRPSVFLNNSNYLSKTAMEISNALRNDIENEKVDVFYQPLVNYRGKVVSSEALLKWRYQGEYTLYPPLITSIAKENGTFDALTVYIIDKVIYDLVRMQMVQKNIGVSVNIEARQLADSDFIDEIIYKIKLNNIPPNTFTLELTEESELKDDVDLKEIFMHLKENGIKIAIDDFSMGHTSIKYLKNNMFDYVKLDGNITSGMIGNDRVQNIVSNVVNLGKALNFYVVAEYVENKEQRAKLHKFGVDIYQGYYYSKPLSYDDFIKYVENNKIERQRKSERKSFEKVIGEELKEIEDVEEDPFTER